MSRGVRKRAACITVVVCVWFMLWCCGVEVCCCVALLCFRAVWRLHSPFRADLCCRFSSHCSSVWSGSALLAGCCGVCWVLASRYADMHACVSLCGQIALNVSCLCVCAGSVSWRTLRCTET